MVTKNKINNLLESMTTDLNSNLKKIKHVFGSFEYKDKDNQTILHILVDDLYDEEKCFLAIKSLLQIGLNPNLLADYEYNFIQTALYAGYSEEFILNIIYAALKYNLNVNHVDSDLDTIMHTAIYSDDYLGEVDEIYAVLHANGFDSSLKDQDGRNLLDAMIYQNQYSKEQIERFKNKFEERYYNKKDSKTKESKTIITNTQATKEGKNSVELDISEKDISELKKYGKILNFKNFIVSPTIGREKELKNLMITLAQDKKRPLIVGESGVGKTAIVDELAYRIKVGQVPSFLQGKIILEVNPSEIVAGCKYVGMFEDNMSKVMKLCEKLDVIVFIDEIHTIYGFGSAEGKDNDMASMIKYYIDRSNLKIIGTTTEKEYEQYFSNDALKRRFEKIVVKEPDDNVLYQIIDKVIGDYYLKNGITFENENIRNDIVNIILYATQKNHRVYNDIVNNPDLAIFIVDKAFAFAKVYDSEYITEEHFIESFEYCDRIYDTTRESSISKLKKLNKNKSDNPRKVLKFDFKK